LIGIEKDSILFLTRGKKTILKPRGKGGKGDLLVGQGPEGIRRTGRAGQEGKGRGGKKKTSAEGRKRKVVSPLAKKMVDPRGKGREKSGSRDA